MLLFENLKFKEILLVKFKNTPDFFHSHINLAVSVFHVVAVPSRKGSAESQLPWPRCSRLRWPL